MPRDGMDIEVEQSQLQLGKEGASSLCWSQKRAARIRLCHDDIYFLPRNMVHQFQIVSAVCSLGWHILQGITITERNKRRMRRRWRKRRMRGKSLLLEVGCSSPAHPARKTSSLPKLYQSPSRPAWSRLLKLSKRQLRKSLPKNLSMSCINKSLNSRTTTTGATN
ncbi:unnamed protein product [Pleuronectes platessa]|uniref:Uncharacterized protein n=1 Tax=Pleuronectes platessa TaxID=8262 RepID=A0A9N7VZ76_PLEPL|nr:unnamed protein product [Pleuronectes platessa]